MEDIPPLSSNDLLDASLNDSQKMRAINKSFEVVKGIRIPQPRQFDTFISLLKLISSNSWSPDDERKAIDCFSQMVDHDLKSSRYFGRRLQTGPSTIAHRPLLFDHVDIKSIQNILNISTKKKGYLVDYLPSNHIGVKSMRIEGEYPDMTVILENKTGKKLRLRNILRGQTPQSLNVQGAYKANLYKDPYTMMFAAISTGHAIKFEVLVFALLCIAPAATYLQGSSKATLKESIKSVLSGKGRVLPIFSKYKASAIRTPESYEDIRNKCTVYEEGKSLYDDSIKMKESQLEDLMRIFERLKTVKSNRVEAVVKRVKDSFDMMPILFASRPIFHQLATTMLARRMSYIVNYCHSYEICDNQDFLLYKEDMLFKLIIGNMDFMDDSKGTGITLRNYMVSRFAPKVFTKRLENDEIDISFPSYEDEMGMATLSFQLEVPIKDVKDKVIEMCDAISPVMYKAFDALFMSINSIETLNQTLSACTLLERYPYAGYDGGDYVSVIGDYTTPYTIRTEENAYTDNEGIFIRTYNALAALPQMEDAKPQDIIGLLKSTSSGHQNSSQFRPKGGRVRIGNENVKADRIRSKLKNVVLPLQGSTIFDPELVSRFGDVTPGGTGERRDILSKIRIVFAQPATTLGIQLIVKAALLELEKNHPVYANIHQSGNAIKDLEVLISLLLKNEPLSPDDVSRLISAVFDSPAWDQHLITALVAMGVLADGVHTPGSKTPMLGPFAKMSEPRRKAFVSVYAKYTGEEGAAFIVKKGDSDPFMLRVGSSTSGDVWTSPLNTFVHEILIKYLMEFFLAYEHASDDKIYDGTWASSLVSSNIPVHDVAFSDPVRFSVTRVLELSREFGDDGIQGLLVTRRSKHDWYHVAKVMVAIMSFCQRVSGFGVNPQDIGVSSSWNTFLNWNAFGVLYRRRRLPFCRERDNPVKPEEQVQAITGSLISGESLRSYTTGVRRVLMTATGISVRGYIRELSGGTLLLPKLDKQYVTALPYPRPSYPLHASDPNSVPREYLIDPEFTPDPQSIGREIASGKVSTMINGVSTQYESFKFAVKRSSQSLLDPSRLTPEPKDKLLKDVWYGGSIERGIYSSLAIAAERDQTLSYAVKEMTIRIGDPVKRNVHLNRRFNIGYNTVFILPTEAVGRLQTDGIGNVIYIRAGDSNPTRTWPLLTPKVFGVCPELLALQAIFGLTPIRPPKFSKEDGTGFFSFDPITTKSILAGMADYVASDVTEGILSKELHYLSVLGFKSDEAEQFLQRRGQAKFALTFDEVEKWKSQVIPELPISSVRVGEIIDPALIEVDEPDDDTSLVSKIIQETAASIAINRCLTSLVAHSSNLTFNRNIIQSLHSQAVGLCLIFVPEIQQRTPT
jgi:hypothetical protein